MNAPDRIGSIPNDVLDPLPGLVGSSAGRGTEGRVAKTMIAPMVDATATPSPISAMRSLVLTEFTSVVEQNGLQPVRDFASLLYWVFPMVPNAAKTPMPASAVPAKI